jgi:capsular polysaccharide transport system permease protein
VLKPVHDQFGKHSSSFWLRFFCVYLPTILTGFYLLFLHSSMYISESSFSIRSNNSMDIPVMPGMSVTTPDAYIIQNYITSPNMLEKIDKELNLREHYGDRSRDVFSRLKKNFTREEFFEYWKWIVNVVFSQDKGIITVEVKAYSPEMAEAISKSILAQSEKLVNEMNERSQQDSIRMAKEEIASAQARLLKAQDDLRKFRDANSMLDPSTISTVLESVMAKLEGEAALAQAELNAALQSMSPDNPQAKLLAIHLQAIRDQLEQEKLRLAGAGVGADTLSALVGDYARLSTEEKFAQDQLVYAMTAYEGARLKAVTQTRYLVPFQPPTLPQESLYPRPLLYTAITFLGFFLALGLCSLIVAAIKDHMGVV